MTASRHRQLLLRGGGRRSSCRLEVLPDLLELRAQVGGKHLAQGGVLLLPMPMLPLPLLTLLPSQASSQV